MQTIILLLSLVAASGVLYLVLAKEQNLKRFSRLVVVDTSALMDGRIAELVRSGFISGRLLVPKFVLAEMQQLADGNNSHKRERARLGMGVVKELQEFSGVEVIIGGDKVNGAKEVDDKLVLLAKKRGAYLFTTDYNLLKLADIEGVKVLNVNELAHGLRPVVLPGETKEIKIIQKGAERNQGVGYLDDGTMIVVENAGNKINRRVKVEFSRTLQTVAGKMMFATLVNNSRNHHKPSSSRVAAPTRAKSKS